MTEAQQRLIDSHMLESMAESIRFKTAFSFNALDMVECLERAANIVKPKLEEVK